MSADEAVASINPVISINSSGIKLLSQELKPLNRDELLQRYNRSENKLQLPFETVQLHDVLSISSDRRQNLVLLDSTHVAIASGNYVIIQSISSIDDNSSSKVYSSWNSSNDVQTIGLSPPEALKNASRIIVPSLTGRRVGAVAVHPSGRWFAVAEGGFRPSHATITIYSWPQLEIVAQLANGGAARAYVSLAFDPLQPQRLASVGSSPDYLLTIWDWPNSRVMLRCKAFSQDVTRVMWSPWIEGALVTCGIGHCRFWAMANTFTGLKLQGQIGKFGTADLSDIEAMVCLPQKTVTSTETGSLLVWDGHYVETIVVRSQLQNEMPTIRGCHEGAIHVLELSRDARWVWSAGEDGWIHRWPVEALTSSISTSSKSKGTQSHADDMKQSLEPSGGSWFIESGASVVCMTLLNETTRDGSDAIISWTWLIQDKRGQIYVATLENKPMTTESFPKSPLSMGLASKCVFDFHGGPIAGLLMLPMSQDVITGGDVDCSLKWWDIHTRNIIAQRKLSAPITCLEIAPETVDVSKRTFYVGTNDGVVRVFSAAKQGVEGVFRLIGVFKPHSKAIVSIAIARDGQIMATTSEDGNVFFIQLHPAPGGFKYSPIGFVKVYEDSTPTNDNNENDEILNEIEFVEDSEDDDSLRSPRSASWRQDGEWIAILVGCRTIVQMKRPTALNSKSTETSYELDGVEIRKFTLKSSLVLKYAPPPHDDDICSEKLMNVEKINNSTIEQLQTINGNDEKSIVENCESNDEKKTRQKVKRLKPNISLIRYNNVNSNALWVGVQCRDSSASRLLFQFDNNGEILRYAHLQQSDGAHLTTFTQLNSTTNQNSDSNAQIAIYGASDGSLHIQQWSPSKSLINEGRFVHICAHGYGAKISGVAMSEDRKILISCANDGCILVNNVALHHEFANESIGRLSLSKQHQVINSNDSSATSSDDIEDIESSKSYSWEEEKMKLGMDRAVQLAENRRLSRIQRIAMIRGEYDELKKRICQWKNINSIDEIPKSILKIIEIDASLKVRLENTHETRVEMLHRQMAWNVQRNRLGLLKLNEYFFKKIEIEHFNLYSIPTKVNDANECMKVSTYRLVALNNQLKDHISMVHRELEIGRDLQQKNNNNSMNELKISKTSNEKDVNPTRENQQKDVETSVKAKTQSERRLEERELRKKMRVFLDQSKPSELEYDVKDIELIINAKEKMGDFKLKSDANYIVPPSHQMNAAQKRRQILLMIESIYLIQKEFNSRIVALRDLKYRLYENIRGDVDRLMELNDEIGDGNDEFIRNVNKIVRSIELRRDEWPEKRVEFNENDLNEYKFEIKRRAKDSAQKNNAFGGGAGDDDSKNELKSEHYQNDKTFVKRENNENEGLSLKNANSSKSIENRDENKEIVVDSWKQISRNRITINISSNSKPRKPQQQSSMEKRYILKRQFQMKTKRNEMIESMNNAIYAFNQSIKELRNEKVQLDIDLKSAFMKLRVLKEEYLILCQFQLREEYLDEGLSRRREEKMSIVMELTQCQSRLSTKLSEISAWQSKGIQIQNEFQTIVGSEKNDFYLALYKIFKRRVKKKKSKSLESKPHCEGDDDIDNETRSETSNHNYDDDDDDSQSINDKSINGNSSSDSENENENDDDDDDGNEKIDVCPPTCDPSLFDKVLELRRKRLDHDEMLSEFTKTVEELRSLNERLQNREKIIDKELNKANSDLELFQCEKQQALNKIIVTIPLKLSQISNLSTTRNHQNNNDSTSLIISSTLNNSLICQQQNRLKLYKRIVELQNEKIEYKREYVDLKRQHKVKSKEIRDLEQVLKREREKCEEIQLHKFGQLLNLDMIQNVTSPSIKRHGTIGELRYKLQRVNNHISNQLNEWNTKIEDSNRQCDRMTLKNTRRLEELSKLTQRQQSLDLQLNNGELKQMNIVDRGPIEKNQKVERLQLVELVRDQSNEIDILKNEVNLLRRKGGFLYGQKQQLNKNETKMMEQDDEFVTKNNDDEDDDF